MSILQEILGWTRGLPAWQSDAIARLFAKQNLGAEDIDDLFALLKAEHGIPDPKGRKANKLSANQIPAPSQLDIHVELIGIKNLQHVNAIADNQKLAFARLMGGVAVPDPDDLLADINILEGWREHVKKRSKEVAKVRKQPVVATAS